jgi:hypothetical protein
MRTLTRRCQAHRPWRITIQLLLLTILFHPVLAQDNNSLLVNKLKEEKSKQKWEDSDISEWKISSQHTDKGTGITYTYIQQYYQNVAVFNAISVFAIKENKVVHFTPGVIRQIGSITNSSRPALSPQKGIEAAAKHLNMDAGMTTLVETQEVDNSYTYRAPELSNRNISVQLVYAPDGNNFKLAWNVSIAQKNGAHWWNVRVDANTGAFLSKNDYVKSCNTAAFESASDAEAENDEAYMQNNNNAMMAGGGSYRVYPYPTEAPNFGPRSLVLDPANAVASPYGWHDVNGVPGPEYTITRGNNVYAYEDATPPDGLPGYSPDGGAALNFDFPINFSNPPASNMDASITNLFYAINTLHDKLIPYGFDAGAGNFQTNNYGQGGIGNDEVRAENFDFSGLNNANFGTPPDGQNPTMQVYIWQNTVSCDNLTITSTGTNGPMTCLKGQFSPIANVTAPVVLFDDGTAPNSDGCTPPLNSLAGKIVLIDRGTCFFEEKVNNAQIAGAVGVIVANNTPGAGIFAMGFVGLYTITIPAVMVSYEDGVILKNELTAGVVSAHLVTCTAQTVNVDASFDNGIVAHEFGHGVSNRLTGGAANSSCLDNAEQGGEGWSDWLALMVTMQAGDASTMPRGMGTYSASQPSTGPGIRRFPYSTDMNVNPLTYGDISFDPEAHSIGEIWCSAIWDMSRFLVDQYGFDANSSNAAAGNNIAMTLVLEGMKLQPCSPGFLDARDAILTADAILYNNAHRCLIWQAFARRGMGFFASEGSSFIAGDETEDFTPGYCTACTGAPEAGTAASNVSTVCSNELFKLKVSGCSTDSNQTFQWQYSTDNLNWNNITGANSYSFSGTQTQATWYRCTLTCNASNLTDSTPAVHIDQLNDCITIANTTSHTCSATFFDTGYDSGNYNSMESFVHTFEPDINKRIKIHFDYFASEQDYDFITIYDGPDATYPILYGPASGALSIPDFVSSHPSGKLTVRFTSDEAVTDIGWRAAITCVDCPFVDDGDACTVDGCDALTGAPNHTPVLITAASAITTPIACYGGNGCVTLTPTGGTPPYNPSAPVCGLTAGFHSITITDSQGCIGTVTVEVSSPLKLTVSTLSTASSCSSNTGTVGATGVDGTPGYSYVWKNASNFVVGTTGVVGGLAGGTYSVTVTDANGCTTTSTAFVSTIGGPPATPGTITGPAGVCKGQNSITFCVTPVAGANSYIWTLPNGMTGVSTGNCITVNVSTQFTGGLLCVKAQNNCGGSGISCKGIVVYTVKPAKPSAITGPPGPLCAGTTATYCVATVPNTTSYNWAIGGNGGSAPLTIINGQGTTCVTINIPAGYNSTQELKVKAQNCKGLSDEQKLKITVIPIPAMPASITGPATICKSAIGFYSISSVVNASTYNWSITNSVWIAGGQGTTSLALDFISSVGTQAVLSVTAGNICGISAPRTKVIKINNCKESSYMTTSGTGDAQMDVNVYPNPTSGNVNIDFISAAETNCLLKLTDLTGKLVMQRELKSVTGENHQELNTDGIAKGAYMLILDTGDGHSVTRLFVE